MRGGCCWVGRRLLLGWAVAVAGLGGGCCWVGRAAGRWTAAVRRRRWSRSRPTQRWVRIAGVETYPTLPSAGWGGAQGCARHRGWAGVGEIGRASCREKVEIEQGHGTSERSREDEMG